MGQWSAFWPASPLYNRAVARCCWCQGALAVSSISVPKRRDLLKTFALQLGLRDDQVLVEADSRNTYENALYTAQMLRTQQWRHVVLITSASHMRRALAAFHKQGIFPHTYPVDYAGSGWRYPL